MMTRDRPTIGEQDPAAPPLVLASRSAARQRMLRDAGVRAIADSAEIDEEEIKAAMRGENATAGEVAESLAELKARRVSSRHSGALVLGADQMLAMDDIWLDKPRSREEAAQHLAMLSGRGHGLMVSAVILQDGTRLWHHSDRAELTMRPLSEDFIAAYLDAMGDDVLDTVGGYRLEGLGAQLFTRVIGDYFTVLGLPLLPLLDFLRNHKVVMT